MKINILFLCDRQACTGCSEECLHTSDIRHSVHYKDQLMQKVLIDVADPMLFDFVRCANGSYIFFENREGEEK